MRYSMNIKHNVPTTWSSKDSVAGEWNRSKINRGHWLNADVGTAKIGLTNKTIGMSGNKIGYFFILLLGIYGMLLPFEELLVIGGAEEGPTLSRYVGMLVIFFFFINFMVSKTPFRPNKAQLWLVLFIGFACLSLAWSINPEASSTRIPTALSLLLFYLVVGTFRPSLKGLNLLILIIIASGVAAALYQIYQYHFLGLNYSQSMRASIILGERAIDPNQFAFSLLLPVSFLLSKIIRTHGRWRRLGQRLTLLTMVYAILMTVSRSGILSLIVIVACYYYYKVSKGIRFAAVVLIILVILVMFSVDVFFQRVTFQHDSFEHARGEIWETGLSALPDYWFLGGGLDVFPHIYMEKSNQDLHTSGPHSIYLGTLIELGIVGLFIMAVAFVYHLRGFRNLNGRQTDSAFAVKVAFLGMLIQATSVDILYLKTFWLVLALITMLDDGTFEAPRQRRHQSLPSSGALRS